MTCPANGQEEREDRKTVLDWRKAPWPAHAPPECPSGHAWPGRRPDLAGMACRAIGDFRQALDFSGKVLTATVCGAAYATTSR
jgi:hypothetical protein